MISLQEEENLDIDTQRGQDDVKTQIQDRLKEEDYVPTEAEIEESTSQGMSRIAPQPPEIEGRHGAVPSLEHLKEAWPWSHLDFRFEASRTVGEYISIV